MKWPAPPLQFLAATAFATDTTAAAMASPSPYRGGRKQWGRGFSDRPYNGGRGGYQQFVTRDPHFSPLRDDNLGFPQGGDRGSFIPWSTPLAQYDQSHRYHRPPPPRYVQNQQFRQPPPFNQTQNHNQQFRRPPPSDQRQGFRPLQQFRPRPPRPLDYREWEYAETPLPPDSERFIVLSYNILADYLAINHRHKLYFHIPRHMLDWEWRKRNILFELGLWSADIMCFQEVDRFQELEEELKLRGYSSIWKMRTGDAIDGCAVFWRTSRFKLLYEESIEFNKLGLRDNVAQICVLELTNQNHTADTSNESALLTSTTASNKVVICNIHVLFNPKRGEIKLGQVRMFLDRAYAVSKIWNDAPVVLCGDFNSTPKSPLYNFISEQKLDISGVDRDKVSGQASAQIHTLRPFNSSNKAETTNSNIQAPSGVDNKLDDSLRDLQKQKNPDKSGETFSSFSKFSQPAYTRTSPDTSDMSCTFKCGNISTKLNVNETKESQKGAGVCYNDGIETSMSNSMDNKESSNRFCCEGEFNVDQGGDEIHKSTPKVTSYPDDSSSDWKKTEKEKEHRHSMSLSNEGFVSERSTIIDMEYTSKNFDNISHLLEVSPKKSRAEYRGLSTSYQIIPSASTRIDNIEDKHPEDDASLEELNDLQNGDEKIVEDQNTFLSELHDLENTHPLDFCRMEKPNLEYSMNEFVASDPSDSQLHLHNDVLNDFSPSLDSEFVDIEKNSYDPSLWTPMEIETATGNADCTILEHSLKLKSTYADVGDNSGTRDSNREPLVTSYNRCFMGTVDYIWCSEGLQTVRVLAPIPKHAMQWTPGFPTKKWGSDHIALASEVAFTKGASSGDVEVR